MNATTETTMDPRFITNPWVFIGAALAFICVQLGLKSMASRFGPESVKNQAKALFAVKASATVLGLLWHDAICQTILAIFLDAGDGTIYDGDTLDPAVTENTFKGWVLRLKDTGAFIALVLTMVPLIDFTQKRSKDESTKQHAALLIAAFHMTPVWSFKGMVQNFMQNVEHHLGLPSGFDAVIFCTVQAMCILGLCSAIRMVLPTPQDKQPYCTAVLALAGASMNAGVGYAFSNIGLKSSGPLWHTVNFQAVYTPVVTAMCLACSAGFTHFGEVWTSNFGKKMSALLKVVPGFVAAWGWQAFLQASAEAVWPPPAGDWQKAFHKLIFAGFVGILAVVIGFVLAVLLAKCEEHDSDDSEEKNPLIWKPAAEEVFATIAGANVGWAWKDFGTAIYTAMGSHLYVWWVLTGVLTVLVPIVSIILLWVLEKIKPSAPKEMPSEKAPLKP